MGWVYLVPMRATCTAKRIVYFTILILFAAECRL